MCFGSEAERRFGGSEYETVDDLRLLFERYRAGARHYAEAPSEDEPVEVGDDLETPVEPVLSSR
jgi:hypothetical protein